MFKMIKDEGTHTCTQNQNEIVPIWICAITDPVKLWQMELYYNSRTLLNPAEKPEFRNNWKEVHLMLPLKWNWNGTPRCEKSKWEDKPNKVMKLNKIFNDWSFNSSGLSMEDGEHMKDSELRQSKVFHNYTNELYSKSNAMESALKVHSKMYYLHRNDVRYKKVLRGCK